MSHNVNASANWNLHQNDHDCFHLRDRSRLRRCHTFALSSLCCQRVLDLVLEQVLEQAVELGFELRFELGLVALALEVVE